jgi:hypothetical protein
MHAAEVLIEDDHRRVCEKKGKGQKGGVIGEQERLGFVGEENMGRKRAATRSNKKKEKTPRLCCCSALLLLLLFVCWCC